jgi:LCP family protein required for cell wall assembly
MYEGLEKLEVPRHRPSGAKRAFRAGLGVLVVMALVIGIGGFFVYRTVSNNISKGVDKRLAGLFTTLPNEPQNILVLGSDRRDVIEGADRSERQFKGGGGQRADTIILLHFDPVKGHAVLVSLPRDLRVLVPGFGHQKINAAYAYGGANLMIKTVSMFTGLQINHYIEVNFSSFRGIVDAVGGVSIYVDRPLVDKKSGLNIPKAGCVHLDGNMALSYVRARAVYASADLGRIQAQQRFMRALMAEVKSVGFLINPGKIINLSNQVGKGLRFDKGVDLKLARTVAKNLAGFDQKHVDFRTVPANCCSTINGQSFLIPIENHDRLLFDALRDGTELPDVGKTSQSVPIPDDVTLKLINATGRTGYAGTQQTALRKLGYHVPIIEAATTALSTTTIVYDSQSQLKAELVAAVYPYARVQAATKPIPGDVEVIFGSNALVPHTASPSAKAKPKTPKPKAISPTC